MRNLNFAETIFREVGATWRKRSNDLHVGAFDPVDEY